MEIEKAKGSQYIVDGAIEAEILSIANKSEGVKENLNEIPMWGELSSGELKNLWFEKPGDFVEFHITEQFETSQIFLCTAVGQVKRSWVIWQALPPLKRVIWTEKRW